MSRKVHFNFTAATTAPWVIEHILVKLSDSVVVSSRTNIEHEGELRLKILAYALVKPFVTVDLSIVSLLEGENEVNSTAHKSLVI